MTSKRNFLEKAYLLFLLLIMHKRIVVESLVPYVMYTLLTRCSDFVRKYSNFACIV